MNLPEHLKNALLAQKCFILSLQNLGLNPFQSVQLDEILKMNVAIASALGIELPDMPTLERMSMEHQALSAFYGVKDGIEES